MQKWLDTAQYASCRVSFMSTVLYIIYYLYNLRLYNTQPHGKLMSNVFSSEASVVTYYCVCMSYDRSLRLHYSLLAVQFSKKKYPLLVGFLLKRPLQGWEFIEKKKERKKKRTRSRKHDLDQESVHENKENFIFLSVFLDAFLVESVFS